MILLVAQLILQNCPTFFMTIWRPLKTAPPGVAGAAGASLRHCTNLNRGDYSYVYNPYIPAQQFDLSKVVLSD